MEMNENGEIIIDAFGLIHDLPREKHLILAESLSCSDTVINHVMDQVLEGCTENGFSGGWSTGYNEPLQIYRKRIAECSSDVAKSQMAELDRQIERLKKERDNYRDMYLELNHRSDSSF